MPFADVSEAQVGVAKSGTGGRFRGKGSVRVLLWFRRGLYGIYTSVKTVPK